MKANTQYFSLAYIVFPPSILDWFDLVNVDEEITDPSKEKLYVGISTFILTSVTTVQNIRIT